MKSYTVLTPYGAFLEALTAGLEALTADMNRKIERSLLKCFFEDKIKEMVNPIEAKDPYWEDMKTSLGIEFDGKFCKTRCRQLRIAKEKNFIWRDFQGWPHDYWKVVLWECRFRRKFYFKPDSRNRKPRRPLCIKCFGY